MTTARTMTGKALGIPEPSLTAIVLPRCVGCGEMHPTARGLATNVCPDCGASTPVGERREAPALITGWAPWKLAFRLCVWAARALMALARSI